MRAGNLRERVTIQTATESQNSYGEPVLSWSDTTTVWGELTPLMARAREAFALQAEALQAKAPHQCRLRYRALSVKTNRLKVNGKIYEIEAVLDPDGRDRETVVLCYEVQA